MPGGKAPGEKGGAPGPKWPPVALCIAAFCVLAALVCYAAGPFVFVLLGYMLAVTGQPVGFVVLLVFSIPVLLLLVTVVLDMLAAIGLWRKRRTNLVPAAMVFHSLALILGAVPAALAMHECGTAALLFCLAAGAGFIASLAANIWLARSERE